MMEFARRLALRSASDPAGAVAALPSRFADRPVRALADEFERRGDVALDSEATSSSTTLNDATGARDRFESAWDETTNAGARTTIGLHLAQVAAERDRSPAQRPESTLKSPARSPLRDIDMARDGEAMLSAAIRSTAAHARQAEREHPFADRSDPDVAPITTPPPARAHAPTSAPTRPIAESTIAAQAATRAAARPIVHVTIDRIDVRAPSPSAAPAAAATRPRPAPAGVSLGDYLRQGTTPSRGRA